MTDEQTPAEDVAFEADDASQEIEALKLEVAALKEQALRYAAEAENTKRRAERERAVRIADDGQLVRAALLAHRAGFVEQQPVGCVGRDKARPLDIGGAAQRVERKTHRGAGPAPSPSSSHADSA